MSSQNVRAVKNEKYAVNEGEDRRGPGWAVWILARFPGVRYRYQKWGETRRVVVAMLLYFMILPIIPVVAAAVWYANDPEGFSRSPLMPVLMVVSIAWLGGFVGVVNQTPITDGSPHASVKAQADGELMVANSNPAAMASEASRAKIASQSVSNATNGRQFESCTAVFDAGVFNIMRNNPSYDRRLDRDNDGIACEK